MSKLPGFERDGVRVGDRLVRYEEVLSRVHDDAGEGLPQLKTIVPARPSRVEHHTPHAGIVPMENVAAPPPSKRQRAGADPEPPVSLALPDTLDPQWRDEALLRRCAQVAFSMYRVSKTDTDKSFTAGDGVETLALDTRKTEYGDLYGVQPAFGYFRHRTSGTLVVAWCGSRTVADWLTNGNTTPVTSSRYGGKRTDLMAHNGMAGIAENDLALNEEALLAAVAEHRVQRLVFTGHSLGGGLAQIAHLLVRGQALKDTACKWAGLINGTDGHAAPVEVLCVAFSAPMTYALPPGGARGAWAEGHMAALAAQLADRSLNMVYGLDLVPRLPRCVEFAAKCVRASVIELADQKSPKPGLGLGVLLRSLLDRIAIAALKAATEALDSMELEALLLVSSSRYDHLGTVLYVPDQEAHGGEGPTTDERVWRNLQSAKGAATQELLGAEETEAALEAAQGAGKVMDTLYNHHVNALAKFAGYTPA